MTPSERTRLAASLTDEELLCELTYRFMERKHQMAEILASWKKPSK